MLAHNVPPARTVFATPLCPDNPKTCARRGFLPGAALGKDWWRSKHVELSGTNQLRCSRTECQKLESFPPSLQQVSSLPVLLNQPPPCLVHTKPATAARIGKNLQVA